MNSSTLTNEIMIRFRSRW